MSLGCLGTVCVCLAHHGQVSLELELTLKLKDDPLGILQPFLGRFAFQQISLRRPGWIELTVVCNHLVPSLGSLLRKCGGVGKGVPKQYAAHRNTAPTCCSTKASPKGGGRARNSRTLRWWGHRMRRAFCPEPSQVNDEGAAHIFAWYFSGFLSRLGFAPIRIRRYGFQPVPYKSVDRPRLMDVRRSTPSSISRGRSGPSIPIARFSGDESPISVVTTGTLRDASDLPLEAIAGIEPTSSVLAGQRSHQLSYIA